MIERFSAVFMRYQDVKYHFFFDSVFALDEKHIGKSAAEQLLAKGAKDVLDG